MKPKYCDSCAKAKTAEKKRNYEEVYRNGNGKQHATDKEKAKNHGTMAGLKGFEYNPVKAIDFAIRAAT